jgi:hypothetical protein
MQQTKTLFFPVREELASLFCRHLDWEFCLRSFFSETGTLKAFQTERGAVECYRGVSFTRDDFAVLAIEIADAAQGLPVSELGNGLMALWLLSSDAVAHLKSVVTYQHVWMRPKFAAPYPAGSVPIDPIVKRGLQMRGL